MLLLHQSPRSMVYWKPLEAPCVHSRTQAAGVDPAIPFPLYLIDARHTFVQCSAINVPNATPTVQTCSMVLIPSSQTRLWF